MKLLKKSIKNDMNPNPRGTILKYYIHKITILQLVVKYIKYLNNMYRTVIIYFVKTLNDYFAPTH